MSREVLFRGKRVVDKRWAESICPLGTMTSGHLIFDFIPETVGQYTGLRDCKRTEEYPKGQMIFEGDIVKGLFLHMLPINAVVAFKDGAFGLEWHRGDIKTFTAFTSICNVEYDVIGNVTDNPELLN